MNDDAQLITAALGRRFARVETPACPDGAWRAATTVPATNAPPSGLAHRFAYAAALVGVVAIGGLAAQAASSGNFHTMPWVRMFVSSKPLMPLIHRADRLTIAEAQRHMPFSIVVPTGLPAGSQFLYAAVISETGPSSRVALNYQAHIASKYYRIAITESTVAVGPPVAHFELRTLGHGTKTFDVPLRRWKHGPVVMTMFASELPPDVTEHIVRANTM